MRKMTIFASAAAMAIAATATPASAAITVCASAGCVQPSSNLLFNNATTGLSITSGLNNSPQIVRLNSNEAIQGIASGQARVTGVDGNLTFLEILLDPSGTFSQIEFNLNAAANGTATLSFFGVGNNLLNVGNTNFAINASGQNFFAAFNETISRVTISSTSQLTDVRQIRIGGFAAASAVPEPSTWALMLLGFGGMGVAMRRTRRQATLQQMA
jgi:hypothetical protein